MQDSKFNISNKLLNAIVKLETTKTALENSNPTYPVRSKLVNRAKAMNLLHLATMIGMTITLREAEKLAEGRKLEDLDQRGNVLVNFRNVLEYNRAGVGENVADVDLNLLLHLNKIVLTDWREAWDVRFRGEGDNIDSTWDNWLDLRDSTLPATQIEASLREVFDWYNANASRMNGVIMIGIVLFRLIEIMPFTAGNKLTIIALADNLLHRYGYTDKTFLPVVRNFDVHQQEYVEAWGFARQNFDLSMWLERFATGLAQDIQENKVEVDQFLAEEEEKGKKQPFLDLNKRQLKILRYLQTIPTVKREDYCQMMEVSTMTAFRDLNDLVRKKLIKIEGRGRGTKYMLGTK